MEELLEAYIFDLDGTLCDIQHRLHYIKGDEKNWDLFNENCSFDIAKMNIVNILQLLSMEYNIIIVTGRMDNNDTRMRTLDWLDRHQIRFEEFYMRPDQDYRSDFVVKEELYQTNIADEYEILGVFDDRDQVVNMWRSLGLTCFQVQKGDY